MTSLMKLLKLIVVSGLIAGGIRYAQSSLRILDENAITERICALATLPLETGLVRETYESIDQSLKARGLSQACVSVTDNGRSFSPDCGDPSESYRAVLCRAQANVGIHAAINYPQEALISRGFFLLWLLLIFAWLLFESAFSYFIRLLLESYSRQVSVLLYTEAGPPKTLSKFERLAQWTLERTGTAATLKQRALDFKEHIQMKEDETRLAIIDKERLEMVRNQALLFEQRVERVQHDIRSPLSSIQALQEKLGSTDMKAAVRLSNAVKRIQSLTDDLSAAEEKHLELKLVIAEVNLIETVSVLREKFAAAKNATIDFVYNSDSLSPISVEPRAFNDLIGNLLENALDAISTGGRATITVTAVGGRCEIQVNDNGKGLSEEAEGKLFEREGTVGKINGTGLGLYNAKLFVESWGGTIHAERLQQGTRFIVRVPLMQTGTTFVGLPSVQVGLRVIDDDPLVAQVLAGAGYAVEASAETYTEGMALLQRSAAPGVITLVDYRLGQGRFGTDLIAEQSARQSIYLCTNDFDDLAVIKRAQAIGVRIVPKPLCFLV